MSKTAAAGATRRLRDAAHLARETAEAATPGPWRAAGDHVMHSKAEFNLVGIARRFTSGTAQWTEDAAHIALWSPPVALAVAAWLKEEADAGAMSMEALAVADALLTGVGSTVEP